MEKHEDKNIQLSEKIEYLMLNGELSLKKNDSRETVYFYSHYTMHILATKKGGRFIDFVNELIESRNLYPIIQQFYKQKKKELKKLKGQ